MNQKPSVGRVVHFYLNEDMVVSPAEIIATMTDLNFRLLDQHEPAAAQGSYYVNESSKVEDASALTLRPELFTLEQGDRVSLRVSGLVKDYRVYNVPYSEEPRAGHWSWPPRV